MFIYLQTADKASQVITKAIDLFQEKVKCCGVAGPADYKGSDWSKLNSTIANKEVVPKSCCKKQVRQLSFNIFSLKLSHLSVFD